MHTQSRNRFVKRKSRSHIFLFCLSFNCICLLLFSSNWIFFFFLYLSPFIYFWILYECLMPLLFFCVISSLFLTSKVFFLLLLLLLIILAHTVDFIFGFLSFFYLSTVYRVRRKKEKKGSNKRQSTFGG